MIQVEIDRARCTGHGRCYALAATVFEPDDDGYGQLITPTPSDEHAEAVRLARVNCPEDAITVVRH